jgi:predicted permease
MATLLQDLRFGVRALRKTPGVTIIAVLALALGIGANTAMFSIVNTVLLRPLPYTAPERLVQLFTSMPQFREASVSYPNFLDWRDRSRSFDLMAAYRGDTFHLTGQTTPERLRGQMASAEIFPTLGVKPIVGRTFGVDEDRLGAAPVVVLTSSFWRTRFGGDPGVLGRSLTLNERAYTVVGVVPSDDVMWRRASVIVPIGQWSEPLFRNRGVGMGMRVLGRLKAGTSRQQAQSELDGIAAGLAREYPTEDKDRGINAVSLRENLTGDVRTPLLVLLGAVGFVLVMACANVANLLLARASSRRRELAIRTALGATRGRVARQLLTESFLLAIGGGVLGLAVARSLNAAFVNRIADLPRADQIHLDGTVLGFTALVALGATLLFGLTPALRSARPDLNDALKEGDRGNTRRQRLLPALVVVEIALGLVLTASAGLMIRTMTNLWNVNPGLDPQHVLTFGVAGSPAVHGTPTAVRNGVTQTIDRLRSVPGVTAASVLFGGLALSGDDSELPYWVDGRPKPEQSQMDLALFYGVGPEYLNVLRIPLLRGRFISAQDTEQNPCAVAIDEELAARAFPNEDPLGRRINLDLLTMKCEVVGIVGHVKHWGLDSDASAKVRSQLYISFRQFPDSVMDLASTGSPYLVRAQGDPYALVSGVKQAIASVSANMLLYEEQSMEDVIASSLSTRRFTRLLLGTFAVLALVLAGVGIYGVVSYTVTQSTHDIGVRMALGADRRAVLGSVLTGAMGMAGLGIAFGAVAAIAATRVMKELLFGISANDPLTFGAVALIFAGVTLLASYLPALRATKVDPIIALRCE